MNNGNVVLPLLLLTYKITKIPILRNVWWRLYHFFKKIYKNKRVRIKIHGLQVFQPFNYTYPITSRLFKNYNAPLIECVYQVSKRKERKITVFDIGAAIGDTVLLIKSNCKKMVSNFYCIEGDIEFFDVLKTNMAQFNNVFCINQILSDIPGKTNNLIRIHSGTASAQGDNEVAAITFDDVVSSLNIDQIDLIKIDTDGYDGKILKGAEKSIEKFIPLVIFEWHPLLCIQTKTNYNEHFSILKKLNYSNFIWFTKFGEFSHFTINPSDEYIQQFADICINATFNEDWHYDIIAFHNKSSYSFLEFANSDYSRNKRNPF